MFDSQLFTGVFRRKHITNQTEQMPTSSRACNQQQKTIIQFDISANWSSKCNNVMRGL